MDEVVCNACWRTPPGVACILRCDHLFCEACAMSHRGPRGLVCPVCSELCIQDDFMWIEVINRRIADAEVKDLTCSMATVACANGYTYLDKLLRRINSMQEAQMIVKYQFMRNKAFETQNRLQSIEHGRKEEMEQLTQAISKYQSENQSLCAELVKIKEVNKALKHTLKDRDRQLENWKHTYAKRNGDHTGGAYQLEQKSENTFEGPSSSYKLNQSRESSQVWRGSSHASMNGDLDQQSKRHRSSPIEAYRDQSSGSKETGRNYREETPAHQRNDNINRERILGSFSRFTAEDYGRTSKPFASPRSTASGKKNAGFNGPPRPPSRSSRGSHTSESVRELFNRPPSRRGKMPSSAFKQVEYSQRSLSTDGIRHSNFNK